MRLATWTLIVASNCTRHGIRTGSSSGSSHTSVARLRTTVLHGAATTRRRGLLPEGSEVSNGILRGEKLSRADGSDPVGEGEAVPAGVDHQQVIEFQVADGDVHEP